MPVFLLRYKVHKTEANLEGGGRGGAPPQGPETAILSEICPALSNRFNNMLLFCKGSMQKEETASKSHH